jgi:hypothetical protein
VEDLSAAWGNKWILRRVYELLDKFLPGRVKIITDWMVKMGTPGIVTGNPGRTEN